MFALWTADKHFIYADIGTTGVHRDVTIFHRSTFRCYIVENECLGDNVPSVNFGNLAVGPYLSVIVLSKFSITS